MKNAAAFSLAILCEGVADMWTATDLADRVLCSAVDWITADTLVHYRRWRGLEESDAFLAWRKVPALAREYDFRVHGAFGGLTDYRVARSALLLLKVQRPDAVVIIRDSDGDPTRRDSLERARREESPGTEWPFPIIIGVADTKRECWVLTGFAPQTPAEERALTGLKRELGFDPLSSAQHLTARTPNALRNAKRALKALIRDNAERERLCWLDCDLRILSDRGRGSGLADYLDEIQTRLVPLFSGHPTED